MSNVRVLQGDITTATVDAIVNAANTQMLGGGGVDGAIHRAAGTRLLDACREVPVIDGIRCPTGEARITGAGELNARHVIHTAGPRYAIDPDPPGLLTSAYRNSFQLALDNNCTSLAVPAVSCGVYGYPPQEAAEIAVGVASEPRFSELAITFYLFGDEIYSAFTAALASQAG